MRFRWRGVTVEVHPLFLVLVAVLGMGRGFSYACLFLLALVAHELGHLAVLTGQGVLVESCRLMPFGSVISPLAATLEPQLELAAGAAGPLHNLVLLAVGWFLHPFFPDPDLAYYFLELNATLALFNLLPFLPLDGGRMLRAHWAASLGWRKATSRLARWGRWGGAGLAATGMFLLAHGQVLASWFVLGWVVWQAGAGEREWSMYAFLRQAEEKHRRLRWRGLMSSVSLVATADTRALEVARQFLPHRYHLVAVLEGGRAVGWVTEEQVWAALRRSSSSTMADALSLR